MINKEAKAFIIGLFLIFLNFPIVLILYFFAPNMMEKIFLIIIPLEVILMGILMIKMNYDYEKKELKNYDTCNGIIKKFDFILTNDKWIKAPVIFYIVNNKEYLNPAEININGIISLFLTNKKIKVYYDKKNDPNKIKVKNPIFTILGFLFIILGIIIMTSIL